MVDDWESLVGSRMYKLYGIAESESELLKVSHQVSVVSDWLKQKFSPRCSHTEIKLVRNGVDAHLFEQACEVPVELVEIPRPIVGFVGTVGHWIDIGLIRDVALAIQSGSVVIIGPVDTNVSVLRMLPNVYLLGRRSYDQVPAFMQHFDVAINPFRLTDTGLGSSPIKVYEYIAAGVPVVSTRLPQLDHLESVVVQAATPAEFVDKILGLLAGNLHSNADLARATAQDNSWESRARGMLAFAG